MTSLISIPVAIAVTPPVPAYVSNLATFQSRELVGAYGPSGSLGKALPLAAALQGWATSSGGGINGLVYETYFIIPDYSGGTDDPDNKRILWSGGGHRSTACNGVFYYDFKDDGTGRPRGAFSVPGSFSALSVIPFNSPIPSRYADGRPNTVHTYTGLVYCANNDRFYQLVVSACYTGDSERGGAEFCWLTVGNQTHHPFNPWNYLAHAGNWIYQGAGEWTLRSPDGTKALHGVHASGTRDARFFNMLTGTWGNMTTVGPHNPDYPSHSNLVWDSVRNKAFHVGGGSGWMRCDINWTNETVSNGTSITITGDTLGLSRLGQSCVFDATRRYRGTGTLGVIWVYGGRNPQSNMNDITEIDPVNLTAVRYSLTGTVPVQGQGGGAPFPNGQYVGQLGRHCLVPEWRVLFVVTSMVHGAFVIKLPDVQEIT